jgi:hypothetical protein
LPRYLAFPASDFELYSLFTPTIFSYSFK